METINQYIKDNFLEPKLSSKNMFAYTPRKNILNVVQAAIPLFHGTVLDLGCGVMPYKQLILSNRKVIDYKGLDWESADYHGENKPDLFWDGETIPLKSESIDCVLATEFLEHYGNTDHILGEINRVLKKGGFIFTTTPFIWNLHENPHDEYRFTPYSLERHFGKAGFVDISIQGTGGWDNSLATMLAMWLNCREMSRRKKKWLGKLIYPIYKRLLKSDKIPTEFDSWRNSMCQGFATIAYKKRQF